MPNQISYESCNTFGQPCTIDPLLNAIVWVEHLLLGSLSQSIAIISIAAIGFLMLTGHFNWKRGIQVVIGCFILFGAASIANGIMLTVLPSMNGVHNKFTR